MANSAQARTFTDSFARGFSFIDDIRARRRAEERLDQRLADERQHREFLRTEREKQGLREQAVADRAQETFDVKMNAIEREEAAREAFARGQDLTEFSDTQIGLQEIARQRDETRRVGTLGELQELGLSQQLQAPDAAAQAQPDAVATGESQLAASRAADAEGRVHGLTQQASGAAGGFTPPGMAAEDIDAQIAQERSTERRAQLQDLLDPPEAPRGIPSGASESVAAQRQREAASAQEELATVERYENLLSPDSELSFEDAAAEDPQLFANRYFQDRATIDAFNPNMRKTLDRKMQPVIVQNATDLTQQINTAQLGTPARGRLTQQLRNLEVTAQQIYNDYKPGEAAGINARGMPVGDQELSQNVAAEITSPDRPRPYTPASAGQVNSALTTVGTIKPNSRLNESQLRAVVRGIDYGFLSPQDAQTVLLTGQLPATSGGVTLKSFSPDSEIWATDSQGNMAMVRPARLKGGEVSANEVTKRAIDDMMLGAASVHPNVDESYAGVLTSLVLENEDLLKKNYDFRNQESMIQLGAVLGQRAFLSAAERHRRGNDYNPFTWESGAPTVSELLKGPELADELAADFKITLLNLKDTPAGGGAQVAEWRRMLQSGDFGAQAAQIGEFGSNEDVEMYVKRRATIEQSTGE